MLILDFRTGKMTKLALNLGDVVSVVGPGALFGIGGAWLGSIIDMLAGTKYRQIKTSSLTGLAGAAGLGSIGLAVPPQQGQQQGQQPPPPPPSTFPEKMEDVPRYVKAFRGIAFSRLDPEQLRGAVDPMLQHAVKGMDGKALYSYLTRSGQNSDEFGAYRPSPRALSVMASLLPDTDKRQFAIRHAAHLNLEMMPLQLCWNELDKNQRDTLFTYFRIYMDELAQTAEYPVISLQAKIALDAVRRLLNQYGKKEHAAILAALHNHHDADIQQFAHEIQQAQLQP